MRDRKWLWVPAWIVLGMVLGGLVLRYVLPTPAVISTSSPVQNNAFAHAVAEVGPAVVGITTLEARQVASTDLNREYFRRFFPDLDRRNTVSRSGSGIVLDSRGYFLTNHHLVASAQRAFVTLSDGREYEVGLVGTDPGYDLAVLRVLTETDDMFVTAPINLTGELAVGEWVLALGYPYGNVIIDPEPTATVGVVSGVQRDVKSNDSAAIYKDMIQTDAAINPGNSGGPLVNASGEVVGINTVILTQGGGSMGLGFAIPIKTAIEVAGELIRHGRVREVWIGIAVQNLSTALASQLGTTDTQGLVVWSLEEGSPADRAGIELGDIIRQVNSEPVRSASEARRSIFGARVEDTIVFGMERRGQYIDIPVRLEELPGQRGRGGTLD